MLTNQRKFLKTNLSNNIANKNQTLCKICNLNSHGKTYCYGCYIKIQKGIIHPPQDKYKENLKIICDNKIIVRRARAAPERL